MNETPNPAPRPSTRSSKVVGALVGAVAALSIGGVGMAFAQEAETPTTEAPAAETPATPEADATPGDRPEECPEKDGEAGGGDAASTDAADEV